MVTMRSFSVLLAASLFALTGCELIGGLDQRTLQPTDAGAADGPDEDVQIDAPPDVISTKCELPPAANASIRVGNLIPAFTRVDFCIKSADEASWDNVEPVLAGGGGGCQRGLIYRNITTTFGVAAGVYDIIAVEDTGGGAPPNCSKPIAQATQVVLTEGQTISALVFGDSKDTAVLKPWTESRPGGVNESAVRFVNALAGSDKLDCGIASVDALPTDITVPGFANVPFASILPAAENHNPAAGKIDANGYLQLQVGGAIVPFAIATAGQTAAMLVKSEKYDRQVSYTAFAAGRLGDKQFPEEMLICDESKADGILTRCGGLPLSLTVDSVNVQLAGAFGPWDKERAQPIQEAIATLPSDVVCVHEAWGKANKDGITQAALANFPNQAVFWHDLDSTVDDATDQDGDVPPEPTEAPCAQSAAKFTAAMDCIKANCVDPAGSESGIPAGQLSNCLTTKCIGTLLPILSGTAEDKACYSCLFGNLAGWETIGYIRDQCANNPKARFAHRGDTAVIVLSKQPIQDAEAWVLGSTEWRVDVVRAPINLNNGATVDVYCTQLTTPGAGLARPYTGPYGGTATSSDDAWREELYLQAHKLVNYVQNKSRAVKRKAIIVGSIYSGPEYTVGDNKVLDEVNVDAYNTISGAFPLAVPQNYVPSCTLCNDNPINSPPGSNPTPGGTWQSFVFLSDIPVTAAESASIFWKETPLTVVNPTNQEEIQIPLSSHYGFRSVVRVLK